jgi:hypothetical protein
MLTAATILFAVPRSQAQDDAPKILKAMSDYVASQKTISATFDSDIEVITSDLQKIQFASSGNFLLSRPDKLRASRTGGYADVELVYDGKTLTVYDKYHKSFVQADAPGSVDQVVDRMRNEFGVEAPTCCCRAYMTSIKDVVDAAHRPASSTASSANISPSAIRRPTGSSGSRSVRIRSRTNTSSPARPLPTHRSTRCVSRIGNRTRRSPRMRLRSNSRRTRRKSRWALSRSSMKSRREA